MKKIGLLGGTFDPIHQGHIQNAICAYEQLNLDEVWLIPVLNNPFEKNITATNQQRLDMMRIATKEFPFIKICDIELKQDPQVKSYTFDTVVKLKKQYPHAFYFIVGYDQVELFDKWYKADQLNQHVALVAIERDGFKRHSNLDKYQMLEVTVEPLNYSSTAIKNGNLAGLDKSVLSYAMQHSIYTAQMIRPMMSTARYEHTLQVANTARMFAKCNGIDENKAYIAGLLHDIAKEMDVDKMTTLMEKFYPQHLQSSIPVWHQWLSSYLAKVYFNVSDEEILQAIQVHTTASTSMSKLDMCLYCADKYEPSRPFDTSKQMALCCQSIEEGFKMSLKEFYEFSKMKNRKIDDIFYSVYKKYLKEDIYG